MLFCHITTRVDGDSHQSLLSEKGGRGFPYLVYMDADGNVIAPHQGARSVDGFRSSGENVVALVALQKRADEGDESAQRELFFVRLDLGQLGPEEIRQGAEALGELSDDEQKKIDSVLVNKEVEQGLKSIGRDRSKLVALGSTWSGMLNEGRIPSDVNMMYNFYNAIMMHANAEGDADLYAKALQGVKDGMSADPQGRNFLSQQRGKNYLQGKERELEALRSRDQ